mmetsp:Transcript_80576/g.127264  ORF Transcript_80576/g.127264 Transcript_80576/m.127264 type:complete len:247 (+) Transcript_80576:185-925(+)
MMVMRSAEAPSPLHRQSARGRRRGWLPAFWMMTWSWAIATPMMRSIAPPARAAAPRPGGSCRHEHSNALFAWKRRSTPLCRRTRPPRAKSKVIASAVIVGSTFWITGFWCFEGEFPRLRYHARFAVAVFMCRTCGQSMWSFPRCGRARRRKWILRCNAKRFRCSVLPRIPSAPLNPPGSVQKVRDRTTVLQKGTCCPHCAAASGPPQCAPAPSTSAQCWGMRAARSVVLYTWTPSTTLETTNFGAK